MGTQFWWFYDVLVVSVVGGILYASAVRGFTKGIFRLAGCVLAIVVGFFGSNALKDTVYESLFRQKITDSVSQVLEDEDWDVFERASEVLAISGEEETTPDAEEFRLVHQDVKDGTLEAYPDWFTSSVCGVTEFAASSVQKTHAEQNLAEVYAGDTQGMCALTELLLGRNGQEASAVLEETFYRPSYGELVRTALFALIGLVVMIVCGIVSSVAGSLEEQMHIRRGDHALGLLAGVAEAAAVLLMLTAAVRLVAALTDGEMLLFNTETIYGTKLFRYLYDLSFWKG